jgi:fucose 4-O-acetylase-like acetyltransferase
MPAIARDAAPDLIRGVAILLVVAIHAFGYLGLPVTGGWAIPWFLVSQIAVPVFFLVEGWLHASRFPATSTRAAARPWLIGSAWRLMLPWAVFSVALLGLRLVAEAAGRAGGAPVLAGGIADLPLALWQGSAAAHLYFLPALLLVRAASLLLHPLVRGRPGAAVLLAAGLVLGWRLGLEPLLPMPERGVEPLLAAATGLGFAAMGWALAALRGGAVPALVAALALGLIAAGLQAAGLGAGRGFATAAQAAYLLAAWAAATALAGQAWIGPALWLGRRTMQVYLLHGIPVRIAAAATIGLQVPAAPALAVTVGFGTLAALLVAALLGRLGLAWLWEAPRLPRREGRQPRAVAA